MTHSGMRRGGYSNHRACQSGDLGPLRPGGSIIRTAVVATAVFAVVAVGAALARRQLNAVAVAVSLVLFAAGSGANVAAFLVAVGRSRRDAIGMGGLFFLQGSAPRPVQGWLLGCLAVQVVVALATAAAHPFTNQAFVVLAPMFGLGCTALWGARHGSFPPRDPTDR